MNSRRSAHKKLSYQIPMYNFANEDDFKDKIIPKSLMHTETSSEAESEATDKIITGYGKPTIPEFDPPIKLIQENTNAKIWLQETKKNLLKMKLLQRLKTDSFTKAPNIFQDTLPENKSKTACNTQRYFAKPEKKTLDESLVNLESEDQSSILQQSW